MSEPFAVVDPGDDDEGEMPTLDFGGICQMTKGDDDDHAESVADFTKYAAKINAAVTARERKAVESAANSAKLRVVFEDDMVRFGLKMEHGSEVVCKDQSVSMALMEAAAVPEMLPVVVYGLDEMKRKAAAQALREAADWLIRFPQSVSDEGKFATANAMLDGITVAVTGLRSRADAIEKGER